MQGSKDWQQLAESQVSTPKDRQLVTSSNPLSSMVAAFIVKPPSRAAACGSSRTVAPSLASAAASPGDGASSSGNHISTGSVHPGGIQGNLPWQLQQDLAMTLLAPGNAT